RMENELRIRAVLQQEPHYFRLIKARCKPEWSRADEFGIETVILRGPPLRRPGLQNRIRIGAMFEQCSNHARTAMHDRGMDRTEFCTVSAGVCALFQKELHHVYKL